MRCQIPSPQRHRWGRVAFGCEVDNVALRASLICQKHDHSQRHPKAVSICLVMSVGEGGPGLEKKNVEIAGETQYPSGKSNIKKCSNWGLIDRSQAGWWAGPHPSALRKAPGGVPNPLALLRPLDELRDVRVVDRLVHEGPADGQADPGGVRLPAVGWWTRDGGGGVQPAGCRERDIKIIFK